jgi:hypothetical protein
LKEKVEWAFRALGPDDGVIMLNLYLDDSGEREQSVGGCIADVKSWKAFEFAWSELLESVGNISTLPRRSPPRVIAGPVT